MSKYSNPLDKLVIRKIEEQKELRTKNLYIFQLSMNPDEEKIFNKKLKTIINEISQD